MTNSTLPDEAQEFLRHVHARLQAEADKPLFVAVMGQTGVGKSSLINALFDTKLPTDPVRPCTMEPTEVTVTSTATDHPLIFVDLPGVGESATADPRYIEMYRRYLGTADVVIWALPADSRSLAGDVAWIQQLMNHNHAALHKMTFVLTKADTVHADPWIVPLTSGLPAQVRVKPGPATAALLDRKCHHARETITAYLPGQTDQRLPIACSSILRYNLTAVMTAVVDHLDDLAIRRLTPHLNIDGLDRSDADEVLAGADLMAFDLSRRATFRFRDLVNAAIANPTLVGGAR